MAPELVQVLASDQVVIIVPVQAMAAVLLTDVLQA